MSHTMQETLLLQTPLKKSQFNDALPLEAEYPNKTNHQAVFDFIASLFAF